MCNIPSEIQLVFVPVTSPTTRLAPQQRFKMRAISLPTQSDFHDKCQEHVENMIKLFVICCFIIVKLFNYCIVTAVPKD